MRSRADAPPAWLWVRALALRGESLALDAEASHHVARVWRAREEQALVLTDGLGGVAHAIVESLRPGVVVRVESVEQRAAPRPLVVWCGAPEGDRGDWLVEKLAELGVTRLIPIDTSRASWRAAPTRLARWERLTRAALEQSRGAFRLAVSAPCSLESALASLPEGAARWLADPEGRVAELGAGVPLAGVVVAVGPAPGFDSDERSSLLARGFMAMSLGRSRLRAETAAMVAAALVRAVEPEAS
ncbi:MAG: RsmE family RNA methyltransferase [Candidatus Eisenbacteria bacterium]|uniref:Ribosomal RNA small subunit methyltransferase E n=1 Tax=Eiseniibacteriota bacterium TaxID=2212470 RepID=A0A849SGW6_UNCEI|nr:RsmE family RNA methyltransferase [Candidatus Eisenbacteria bacterium]